MRRGTIRGTVLIETILAAFEMEEIIYELREHTPASTAAAGTTSSVIKRFRQNPDFVLPDRSYVDHDVPFMDAYVKLLIKTCHRRGVHAMGGMAAQIPIKNDPAANEVAMTRSVATSSERSALATTALGSRIPPLRRLLPKSSTRTCLPQPDVRASRGSQRVCTGPTQHECARQSDRGRRTQEPGHRSWLHGGMVRGASVACRSTT